MNSICAYASLFLPGTLERMANAAADEERRAQIREMKNYRNGVYVGLTFATLFGVGTALTLPPFLGSQIMLLGGTALPLSAAGFCAKRVHRVFFQIRERAQPNAAAPHYV